MTGDIERMRAALDRLEAACEAVTEAIDRIGNSEEAKGVCASAILGRFWITDASNRLKRDLLWRGSENRRRLERCIEALRQHLPREDDAE